MSGEPFGLPLDLAPVEAKTATSLPDANGPWQYEPKWDGFRCLAFKAGGEVDLRAKSGKPLARFFPEMIALLRDAQAERFVLDGELVVAVDGALSFDALQMRLHPAESRIRKLSQETPARFVVFDALQDASGALVLDKPLTERRGTLEVLLERIAVPERLVLSPATTDRAEAAKWLTEAGHGETDGVVAKHRKSPYRPGERDMVKVKRLRTADCVVGGFRYESDSPEVGSLLLGLYDEAGRLNHVGFTTLKDADRPALTRQLEALREAPGFTGKAPGGPSRWATERSTVWEPLRPELVVEVRFDHVTGDRFRHGTKLLRWRPDKAPRQCRMEQMA